MQSIFNEISHLRGERPLIIDYRNSNRYRLVTSESNGTKTAYCFSTPIYNLKSRKMIDLHFCSNGGVLYAVGSNTNITVSNGIRMENPEGYCLMEIPQKPALNSGKEIRCGNNTIYPTTNGIALKAYIKDSGRFSFTIEVGQPFMDVRANDKYFALMRERFRPFVTFSCIGTLDSLGQLIAPAKIEYQKLTDRKYRLTVLSTSQMGTYVLFEGNLYENKLFQDTTVENFNPKTNNAFGSTAFIGNTALFGEQWLYSRPDYSKISELMDKRINKATLHLPKYNKSNVEFSALKVTSRFCSFGSNWDNKIASGALVSESVSVMGYQSVNLTPLIVDPKTRTITRSEGMILKSNVKSSGFSAVATGDSCYAPQILEINYR